MGPMPEHICFQRVEELLCGNILMIPFLMMAVCGFLVAFLFLFVNTYISDLSMNNLFGQFMN